MYNLIYPQASMTYFQQRSRRQRVGMSPPEINAIKKFISSFVGDLDPIPIAKVLRKTSIINEMILENILYMQRKRVNHRKICEELLNETINTCSIEELIKALNDNDFIELAGKLFNCFRECQTNEVVHRSHRGNSGDRSKMCSYFNTMKQLVQEMAFEGNAYSRFHVLAEKKKLQILKTANLSQKTNLWDQFVILKAVQMDALTNTNPNVSKDHLGYKDIEKYIEDTSNPDVSRVILYSRKSIASSTTGNFDDSDNFMKHALSYAEATGSCVEVIDMHYKNVVVNLSKLNITPHDENLRNAILYESQRGLWMLAAENDDVCLFWTKAFLLRMVFAHLGIGKSCRMIENYIPKITSISKAEQILQHKSLNELEHRRQMLLMCAKARLNELKGHLDSAIEHLKQARQLAREGNYTANEALGEYENFLNNYERKMIVSTQCSRNKPFPMPVNLEPSVSINVSSFQTSDVSLESSSDEETDIKQCLLNEIQMSEM